MYISRHDPVCLWVCVCVWGGGGGCVCVCVCDYMCLSADIKHACPFPFVPHADSVTYPRYCYTSQSPESMPSLHHSDPSFLFLITTSVFSEGVTLKSVSVLFCLLLSVLDHTQKSYYIVSITYRDWVLFNTVADDNDIQLFNQIFSVWFKSSVCYVSACWLLSASGECFCFMN